MTTHSTSHDRTSPDNRETDEAAMKPDRLVISPDRQRVFEAARRGALALRDAVVMRESAFVMNGRVRPEVVEQYRLFLEAMGYARGTPGGEAVAALVRHGYVVDTRFRMPSHWQHVLPIDTFHIVGSAMGLPCQARSWQSIEWTAGSVDLSNLPPRRIVSAHLTLRLKTQLRRERLWLE